MNKTSLIHNIIRLFFGFGFVCLLALTPFVVSLPSHGISLNLAHAQTAAADTSANCTGAIDCAKANIQAFLKWNNNINVFGSLLRPGLAVLAAVIIELAILLMQIASGLFDTLVTYTIIAFGDTNGLLNPSVISAINTAWTALRGISNILIIGFFTFIAISIIAGSAEFGQKKLIARVLIVAVLINFSLLFTKIIIDFSNYTATQFYNASIGRNLQGSGACPGSPGCPGNPVKADTIGDRFIRITKMSSFSGAAQSINEVGKEKNNYFMLVYAIMIFILIMGVAMVLFYGSFILASRAILLIFLMVTAALAFASHLLPDSYTNGKPGWDMWWRSLIESAVLAPILMLFLWMTLTVGQRLADTSANGGKLGDLIENPTQTADLGALFSYLVIVGLLFASFKIASSFSTSISGFNWASVVPAMSIASSARLAGFAGQRSLIAGSKALNTVGNRLNTPNSRFATLGGGLLNTADRLRAVASRGSRGGGGLAGAVVARQVHGTGLNEKNLFPARAATQAIADAVKRSKQPPAGTSRGQLPPPKPGAGDADATHTAIADSSGDLTKIKREEQARIEATKQITDSNKNLAEEIKGAVAAGGSSGAGEVGKQVAGVLEKQNEANQGSMEEMTKAVVEGQKTTAREIGEEFKSATTTIGGTFTKGMEGVQKITQKASEVQTKAIETSDNKRLEQEVGAARERAASVQKGDNRATQANIEAAQIQAKTATQHFADLRIAQAPTGARYEPAAAPASQSSSMAPIGMSGSATAVFAQPKNIKAPENDNSVSVEEILRRVRKSPPGSVRNFLRPTPGTGAANDNYQSQNDSINKA